MQSKFHCSLLLVFFSFLINAQENPLGRNGIGFELLVNRSQKSDIIRNHPRNSGASVSSKPVGSVELRASYFRILSDYWGVEGGFLWGNYTADTRYSASASFIGDGEDLNSRGGDYSLSPYWGIHMGVNHYFLTQRPRVVFAAFAKLNVVRFDHFYSGFKTGLPSGVSPISAQPNEWFFNTQLTHNPDSRMAIAPEIGLNYFGKWGRNIWVKASISTTYSGLKPIIGTYQINGANDSLTGSFEKRFAHLSFGFSLFYSPKWLWP